MALSALSALSALLTVVISLVCFHTVDYSCLVFSLPNQTKKKNNQKILSCFVCYILSHFAVFFVYFYGLVVLFKRSFFTLLASKIARNGSLFEYYFHVFCCVLLNKNEIFIRVFNNFTTNQWIIGNNIGIK